MRTIIAGGRDIHDQFFVNSAMEKINWTPTVILCGEASGVDMSGASWAFENEIPVEKYPANWSKHGRAAGPIRNAQMAKKADALVLIWDGKSRGSQSMLNLARKYDLEISIYKVD